MSDDFENAALYTLIRHLRGCGLRVYRGMDFHDRVRFVGVLIDDVDQMEITIYCPLDAYKIWHAGASLGSVQLNDPYANEKAADIISNYIVAAKRLKDTAL
jgi:hypothetical protein